MKNIKVHILTYLQCQANKFFHSYKNRLQRESTICLMIDKDKVQFIIDSLIIDRGDVSVVCQVDYQMKNFTEGMEIY